MKLPITVLLAARNEEANLPRCLHALGPVQRVVLLDSHSTDRTAEIASSRGAEVVQFSYSGGYPKKRQWALENVPIQTPWVLLLDADEVVPQALWDEIARALAAPDAPDGFLIRKGFHFMGRPFRFGGFSFAALLLFRTGKGRFERSLAEQASGLDMEIHERVILDGRLGQLHTPLIHEDFKGLQAFIERHNRYSTWEAALRHGYFQKGLWGDETIKPRLFGNTQERRRALKGLAIRIPFEPWLWFGYHYFLKLGILEGRPGLIASQLRAQYIFNVRAKLYELRRTPKKFS